jgi:hypothetical protein
MKRSLKELLETAPEQIAAPETSALPRGFKSVEGEKVTVDMDFLRGMNIFFATPCYGGLVTDQYFLSVFKLTQVLIQYRIPFRITTLRNESLIPRARNILTAMFLEDSTATHLMFIDADIEFEPDSVIRMLALDKDIVAGAYPKKTINWGQVESAVKADKSNISTYGAEYAINLKIDPETKKVRTTMGALEVLDASTGFMLVKRRVFEKMTESYPELHYKNDSSIDGRYNKYCYALWDTMIDPTDRRYLSEDYTFCRRWQNLGGEIWVDPNTKLNHVGSYTYEGDLSNIIRKA